MLFVDNHSVAQNATKKTIGNFKKTIGNFQSYKSTTPAQYTQITQYDLAYIGDIVRGCCLAKDLAAVSSVCIQAKYALYYIACIMYRGFKQEASNRRDR